MRWSTIVLTATALLLIPEWVEAGERLEPGGAEFLRKKHPNSGKEYYVVHTGQSNQCSIVAGRFGDPPVGAIDDKPMQMKNMQNVRSQHFPIARAERRRRTR